MTSFLLLKEVGVGPWMNKFEQFSSDYHQVSVAGRGRYPAPMSGGAGGGGLGYPIMKTHDAFDVTCPSSLWTQTSVKTLPSSKLRLRVVKYIHKVKGAADKNGYIFFETEKISSDPGKDIIRDAHDASRFQYSTSWSWVFNSLMYFEWGEGFQGTHAPSPVYLPNNSLNIFFALHSYMKLLVRRIDVYLVSSVGDAMQIIQFCNLMEPVASAPCTFYKFVIRIFGIIGQSALLSPILLFCSSNA